MKSGNYYGREGQEFNAWAREMSTDKLNNPGNRVTTIDTNGVRQSNDLAKPVHALSMKLFRTYAGEDPGWSTPTPPAGHLRNANRPVPS